MNGAFGFYPSSADVPQLVTRDREVAHVRFGDEACDPYMITEDIAYLDRLIDVLTTARAGLVMRQEVA